MSSFSEFLSEDTLWDCPKLSWSPVPGRYIHLRLCFCGYLPGVRQTQRLAQHRAHSAVLYRNTCWAESKGVRIRAKKTSYSIAILNGIVTNYTASSFFPKLTGTAPHPQSSTPRLCLLPGLLLSPPSQWLAWPPTHPVAEARKLKISSGSSSCPPP